MRFRDIVTGWFGKMSDLLVFKILIFFNICEKGKRLNGKAIVLFEGYEIREYIVGDSGFFLLLWLIIFYRGKGFFENEVDFNRRYFVIRMVVRRVLVRLKEMWKIIYGIMWRFDKYKLLRIIFVCCLFYNIIIDLEDEVEDEMSLCYRYDVGYR